MAKRARVSENEKNTSRDVDINSYKMEQFNLDVCKLKHAAIDKELNNVENNNIKRHEELIVMIQNIKDDIKKDVKSSNDNLKDKIVLTEKIIGDKIDKLSDFDDSLKGNGNPGIWESIRILKWKFRALVFVIFVIFILVLGGNFRGITVEKIKDIFKTKTIQVDKKENIIIEEQNQEPFFVLP